VKQGAALTYTGNKHVGSLRKETREVMWWNVPLSVTLRKKTV